MDFKNMTAAQAFGAIVGQIATWFITAAFFCPA